MTERHDGYIVTLADDIREDDAEHIVNALRMVRGVLSVEPVRADLNGAIADERAKGAMREKLLTLLEEMR